MRLLSLSSFRPLRHRNFALLWSAALVSNVGSWVQSIAVGVLVTDLTGQARWTGLVAAAAFLPMGLLSPVGGAMADRVDRRRWLLLTTIGETAFAVLLAVLVGTGQASASGLTIIVLGAGTMTALGFPAYQAILPDLVGRDELLGATSLSMAQFNLGRIIGPAIAGMVLALGSYTWAFAVNAASYGAVIVALLFVRLPHHRLDATPERVWSRIKSGFRAAMAEPGCRMAIGAIGVTAFLLSPFIALIPAVAIKLFDAGGTGTSLLVAAQGVGAVAGALALAPLAQRFGRRRVLVVNLAVLPLLLVLYAVSPTLPLAAVALVTVGAAYVGILSGLGTVVQLRAPAEFRARILSLYMVALGAVYPVGAVVQGFLDDHFGERAVTSVCALVFLGIVVLMWKRRPETLRHLDDPYGSSEPAPALASSEATTLPRGPGRMDGDKEKGEQGPPPTVEAVFEVVEAAEQAPGQGFTRDEGRERDDGSDPGAGRAQGQG